MKSHKLLLAIFALSSLFAPIARGEEMIDIVKRIFKDKDPAQIGKCENVRELKYPGQKFWHTMSMTIAGDAQIVTERCWGWFKTRSVIHMVHSSKLILVETVVSTEKELEEGIIRSVFRIQRLDEQLAQSHGESRIGSLSSKDIFKEIKTICEKYGSDKVEQDPWVWVKNPGLKILNKFLLWTDRQINSDGTVVISGRDLEKAFPEYKVLVSKFRDFKGTVITSTWKFGEGYTSINFLTSALKQEDKEAIAKLIYRTNPISVKEILPDGKRSGDTWMIDSDTIGGIVFDLGLDFDDVNGRIMCRHLGRAIMDGEDVPDEAQLTGKTQLNMQNIEIPRDDRSLIKLVSYSGKAGDVTISFTPSGRFSIFDDYDKDERHLYYLKEAHISGVLKSKVSRTTSLLRNIEFKDANLQIRLEYVQNRMGK